MTVYVALLRGINVGGRTIVRMERLREAFAALGLENVSTYINSGNVIFKSPTVSRATLSKRIEEKISYEFGFPIPVVVRKSEELVNILASNPFLKEKEIDQSKLHVTFLSETPSKSALAIVGSLKIEYDRFTVKGEEIYLYTPRGSGRSTLSNNTFEKTLSVRATTRNWKTVNVLAKMSTEQES